MINIQEKINLIRKIALENDITAYEIGKNTEVSQRSAYNILTSDEISPRNKTLNIILNYLENTIVGTEGNYSLREEFKTKTNESTAKYSNFNDLKIDDKLNIIYKLQQKTTSDLETIGMALSKLLLDKEETQENVTQKKESVN